MEGEGTLGREWSLLGGREMERASQRAQQQAEADLNLEARQSGEVGVP